MKFSAISAAGACLHAVFSSSRTLSGVTAGALLLIGATASLDGAQELNSIAAKVNGKGITTKEVNFHLAPALGILQAKYPRRGDAYNKEVRKARNAILDQLIENKIVLSELEERGAAIPPHVIDGEVKRIIREVFNGSEKEFRKSLAESGMNMNGFRESQGEKILIQAFRSQQFKDVPPPTANEINAHYKKRRSKMRDRSKDKVTFQKIFIRSNDPENPASTPELQLGHAEEIAKQLRDGGDFGELAKEHSAGAFSATGGLWEDEERINLSPAFSEVIFESKDNTIVGPLKDPAGFIIIKVLKKSFGPAPSLAKVRDRMRQEVEIEKRAARYDKWMAVVKRNAMIRRL